MRHNCRAKNKWNVKTLLAKCKQVGFMREWVSPGNPTDLMASSPASPGGRAVPAARTVVHSFTHSFIHSCLGSFIVLGQLYAVPCIISTIIMLHTFVYLPRVLYIGACFSIFPVKTVLIFIQNTSVMTGATERSSKSERLANQHILHRRGFFGSQ